MLTRKIPIAFRYCACVSLLLHLYGMLAGVSKCGEPNLKLRLAMLCFQ